MIRLEGKKCNIQNFWCHDIIVYQPLCGCFSVPCLLVGRMLTLMDANWVLTEAFGTLTTSLAVVDSMSMNKNSLKRAKMIA